MIEFGKGDKDPGHDDHDANNIKLTKKRKETNMKMIQQDKSRLRSVKPRRHPWVELQQRGAVENSPSLDLAPIRFGSNSPRPNVV